jgi:peptidoglycan hydrolase-like protein with peptidoglycan-binding domain
VAKAEAYLHDLQEAMAAVFHHAGRATPEYERLRAQSRKLASALVQARQQLKASTAPLAQALCPLSPEVAAALPKFSAAMGRAPGMVSAGPAVAGLQQLLNQLGIVTPRTGVYDARTTLAVKDLQTRLGQVPTGKVGLETRQALNRLIGKA